jgi:hypothetical protein
MCSEGWASCGGDCVDTMHDGDHCGSCAPTSCDLGCDGTHCFFCADPISQAITCTALCAAQGYACTESCEGSGGWGNTGGGVCNSFDYAVTCDEELWDFADALCCCS